MATISNTSDEQLNQTSEPESKTPSPSLVALSSAVHSAGNAISEPFLEPPSPYSASTALTEPELSLKLRDFLGALSLLKQPENPDDFSSAAAGSVSSFSESFSSHPSFSSPSNFSSEPGSMSSSFSFSSPASGRMSFSSSLSDMKQIEEAPNASPSGLMIEELLPQRKEILRSGKGRQVPCRDLTNSSLDPPLKGRDCAELPVQQQSPVHTAQFLSKVDIGMAATFLETMGLARDELTICRSFDIWDRGFSTTKWRGITTLSDNHEKVMGSPPSESDPALFRDIDTVKGELGTSSPKGLLFRRRIDETLHCFRPNHKKAEIEYFDRSAATWRPGSQQDLDQLQLKDSDQIVALGGKPLEIMKYHELPTPLGKSPAGFFYHEQQQEGLCGLHAMNAFFGYSAIDPLHLQKWLRDNSGLSEESLYETSTQIDDITKGIDPVFIQRYLNFAFAEQGPIEMIEFKKDQTGRWTQPDLSWIPPSCDRAIIGYRRPGQDHFVAVRKDPAKNTWHYIDSLQDQNYQRKAYRNLYDITLDPVKAPQASRELMHGDSMYILYRNA